MEIGKKIISKKVKKGDLKEKNKITNKGILNFFLRATAIMFIVALIGGGIVTLAGVKIYKSIDDINHIKYNEILKLNEEKYLVYFYEEDNEICINIEPDIVKYSKKTSIPMYVVNMSNNENKEGSKKINFYIDNSNKEKINITSSPKMYLVEDGKIVDNKDNFIDMMGLIGRFYIN